MKNIRGRGENKQICFKHCLFYLLYVLRVLAQVFILQKTNGTARAEVGAVTRKIKLAYLGVISE